MTAAAVAEFFAPMKPSRVLRYEAPNLLGLNFMLYDILAGGASQSLRIDTQGKTLDSALLQMAVAEPLGFASMRSPA